jgi:hypothetical protein
VWTTGTWLWTRIMFLLYKEYVVLNLILPKVISLPRWKDLHTYIHSRYTSHPPTHHFWSSVDDYSASIQDNC